MYLEEKMNSNKKKVLKKLVSFYFWIKFQENKEGFSYFFFVVIQQHMSPIKLIYYFIIWIYIALLKKKYLSANMMLINYFIKVVSKI